jgi:hypothetical protein
MRTPLIYPGFPNIYRSFKHVVRFLRGKTISPLLDLLTTAEMLQPAISLAVYRPRFRKLFEHRIE